MQSFHLVSEVKIECISILYRLETSPLCSIDRLGLSSFTLILPCISLQHGMPVHVAKVFMTQFEGWLCLFFMQNYTYTSLYDVYIYIYMRRFFSLSKSQLSSLQCRVHSYCLDFKYVQGTMQNHAESFVRISFATGPCRTNWPQRCRWGSFSDALEGNMATILVLQIYLFIGIYLFISIYIYIYRGIFI